MEMKVKTVVSGTPQTKEAKTYIYCKMGINGKDSDGL
jgi:hypothetical protein